MSKAIIFNPLNDNPPANNLGSQITLSSQQKPLKKQHENFISSAIMASPLNSNEKIDILPQLQGTKDGKGMNSNNRPVNRQTALNSTHYSPSNGQIEEVFKQQYKAQQKQINFDQSNMAAQEKRSQKQSPKFIQPTNSGGPPPNASRQHRLTKSYNFDSVSQQIVSKDNKQNLLEGEQRTSKGNIIALTGGPLLKKKRYINPKIELELIDFKKEIEEKFQKSPLRPFIMPRKPVSDEGPPQNESGGIFNQSRVQKGRQIAQSTDVTLMQNYLQNVQIGLGQPIITKTGNLPTQRKNPKKPILNSLNISADYNPHNILSPQINQFTGLSTKAVNNANSVVRSLINQPENSKISLEDHLIGRQIPGQKRKLIHEQQRYNEHSDNKQSQQPIVEEYQVNRSMIVEKINAVKGIGQTGQQQTLNGLNQISPQAVRAPAFNNKNGIQEFYINDSLSKGSRQVGVINGITNMASKTRYNKNAFDESFNQSPKYSLVQKNQGIAGREKNVQLIMPKLNNINIAQKNENIRNHTHLRLDPIEAISPGVQHYVNQNIELQANHRNVAPASMQFQKGMLASMAMNYYAPIESQNNAISAVTNYGKPSYQRTNQNERVNPLTQNELEREQNNQRIISTYIRPNQGNSNISSLATSLLGGQNLPVSNTSFSQANPAQNATNSSFPRNEIKPILQNTIHQPRQGKIRNMKTRGISKQGHLPTESQLPVVFEQTQSQLSNNKGNSSSQNLNTVRARNEAVSKSYAFNQNVQQKPF